MRINFSDRSGRRMVVSETGQTAHPSQIANRLVIAAVDITPKNLFNHGSPRGPKGSNRQADCGRWPGISQSTSGSCPR